MSVSIRPDGAPFPIPTTTGAVTVNAARADVQTLTLTGDVVIAFAGFPPGRLKTVRMFVTQGAHAITWPASVHWLRGTPPPPLTNTSKVTFTSIDAGATVLADYAGVAAPDVQDFTASGTWTKPAGATWLKVELISGGGGSAGGTSGTGGGGGGYRCAWFKASQVADSVAVTVGAGGAAATTGSGGASSFGSYLIVDGGKAGTGANDGYTGGAGGGGGIRAQGMYAPNGVYAGGTGGTYSGQGGGDSMYGGGGGNARNGTRDGLGGTSGDASALLGGNGGNPSGIAPGGGGSASATAGATGARGQARITTYFD